MTSENKEDIDNIVWYSKKFYTFNKKLHLIFKFVSIYHKWILKSSIFNNSHKLSETWLDYQNTFETNASKIELHFIAKTTGQLYFHCHELSNVSEWTFQCPLCVIQAGIIQTYDQWNTSKCILKWFGNMAIHF